jgi:hypothetical protein
MFEMTFFGNMRMNTNIHMTYVRLLKQDYEVKRTLYDKIISWLTNEYRYSLFKKCYSPGERFVIYWTSHAKIRLTSDNRVNIVKEYSTDIHAISTTTFKKLRIYN